MSSITTLEKQKLEVLFKMKQGFLLNFSDASFYSFVYKSVGKDIRNELYRKESGSKANRMRQFWKLEPDHLVAKLIFDLCQYFQIEKKRKGEHLNLSEQELLNACINISKRLANSVEVASVLNKEILFENNAAGDIRWNVALPNNYSFR